MTYSSNGLLSRDAQLKQHLPLVTRIANRMMGRLPSNIQVDDLIQVGMIGLFDAMNRFDPNQGVKFETFVTQRIQGAMLDDLRSNDPMSRGLRKSQKEISACTLKLQNQLSRRPMESEIAKELGISLVDYQEMVGNIYSMQEIHIEDMASSDDESDNFLDRYVGSSESDPSHVLSNHRMKGALVKAIKELSLRDQQIMSMYYEQDMNLKEIADVMSLTESRISQLMTGITKGLKIKMRQH